MRQVLTTALDAATNAGASYVDVRVVEGVSETLSTRGANVEGLDRSESLGYGVRVLRNGAWGYAASPKLDLDEVARIARVAVEVAEASSTAQTRPVELVDEPVHAARGQRPWGAIPSPYRSKRSWACSSRHPRRWSASTGCERDAERWTSTGSTSGS